MFASIARRYDRANDILSAGMHHRWRRRLVQRSRVRSGEAVLDCATGTGHLAIAFHRAGAMVTGIDFVEAMLELARLKAPEIEFRIADVLSLPFPGASFDIASIGFGIRNVSDASKAIAEMARVVRPGGRVAVLEFGQPRNRFVRALYDFYRHYILPRLGGAITGQRKAYQYLESSVGQFPSGEDFVALMQRSANFASIFHEPLTFGIVWVYVGVTAIPKAAVRSPRATHAVSEEVLITSSVATE